MTEQPTSQERADILEVLAFQRGMLMTAVEGVTDEQARQRTTISELTLGGIVKHLADTETGWMNFVERGAQTEKDFADFGPEDWQAREETFHLAEDETLEEVLESYRRVAARTDELVRTADLDRVWPLPPAPWNPPGATRTVRRVFLGMAVELAQHCGHADIIREALDGKKSMG